MSWLWKYVVESANEGLYDRRDCIGGIVVIIPRRLNVTLPPKKLKRKVKK